LSHFGTDRKQRRRQGRALTPKQAIFYLLSVVRVRGISLTYWHALFLVVGVPDYVLIAACDDIEPGILGAGLCAGALSRPMGIAIDELSEEQARYLVSWEEGT